MKAIVTVWIYLTASAVLSSATGWATPQQALPQGPSQAPATGTAPVTTPPDMQDIHDIRPTVDPGMDPLMFYWIGAALLLALLVWGLIRYLKRRKKKTESELLIPPQPAEVVAMDQLDRLEKSGYADVRVFYFSLSAILRTYLGSRYEINAPEMTTEELLPQVDRMGLALELEQPLKELLLASEPIKFAGQLPTRPRMKTDLEFSRKLVVETTPKETGEPQDARTDEAIVPQSSAPPIEKETTQP